MLIGETVKFIQQKPHADDLSNGLLLIIILAVVLILSAISNAQYNIRGQLLQLALKGGLSRAVFSMAMSTTIYEWSHFENMTESQVCYDLCKNFVLFITVYYTLLYLQWGYWFAYYIIDTHCM